jgi:hypothetical protein
MYSFKAQHPDFKILLKMNVHHAKIEPHGQEKSIYHLAGVMYYTDNWKDRPIILHDLEKTRLK